MEMNLQMLGDLNNKLLINDIKYENKIFSANFYLSTDWYEANVKFNFSIDRLITFSKNIDTIINKKVGSCNFINDNGNVDINIILNDSTGKVQIKGILIKDMLDESRIEYFLESDYHNLEKFQSSLKNILDSQLD